MKLSFFLTMIFDPLFEFQTFFQSWWGVKSRVTLYTCSPVTSYRRACFKDVLWWLYWNTNIASDTSFKNYYRYTIRRKPALLDIGNARPRTHDNGAVPAGLRMPMVLTVIVKNIYILKFMWWSFMPVTSYPCLLRMPFIIYSASK